MKKIILLILIIFWMSLIFNFSNKNAVQSESNSNAIIDFIIDASSHITGKNYNELQIQNFYDILEFPIRKSAHFTLYLILGVLVYLFVVEFNINKKIIISLLICVIFALSDEIHQLFIEGRSGELRDVLIDMLGSFVGIIFIKKIKELKK